MTVTVKTAKRFDARKLGNAAKAALRDATLATAFAVKARATPEIPVDTGFAKNTLYIKAPGSSEYDEAVANATAALQSSKGAEAERALLPETSEQPEDTSTTFSVIVTGAAEYLFWLHEGARGRAGIPFFSQAAEDEREPYSRRVAKALDGGFASV